MHGKQAIHNPRSERTSILYLLAADTHRNIRATKQRMRLSAIHLLAVLPSLAAALDNPNLGILTWLDDPTASYPLKACQGGCDDDSQCEGDLLCFQRDGIQGIPGCSGVGVSGGSYCYLHTSFDGLLQFRTNHLDPLDVCNGQCDDEGRHCQLRAGRNNFFPDSYLCYNRSGTEPVPGCAGEGQSGESYCYDPYPNEITPMVDVVANGEPSSAFPLGLCQGDCEQDSDCEGDLRCFVSSGYYGIPGCSGGGTHWNRYCYYHTTTSGTLVDAGQDELPHEAYPLNVCEGDCDNYWDCAGTLECYQRDGDEPVPGCAGTGITGSDYCYDPNPSRPALTISGRTSLLAACEGGCQTDDDCEYSLLCLQHDGVNGIPGCTGLGQSGKGYCYEYKDNIGSLAKVDGNGTPLAVCQGGCDSDSDCLDELACFKRDSYEFVPGCAGVGTSGMNYCYDPSPPIFASNWKRMRYEGFGTGGYHHSYIGDFKKSKVVSTMGFKGPKSMELRQKSVATSVYQYDKVEDFIELRVSFFYRSSFLAKGDSFLLEYKVPEQSNWVSFDTFRFKQEWSKNGVWHKATSKGLDVGGINGVSLRFRSVFRKKKRVIHIDNIMVEGRGNELVSVGDENSPSGDHPLGECEGDCDTDSDCKGSLLCFQRNAEESVPGCSGVGYWGYDYCYIDTREPTESPTSAPTDPVVMELILEEGFEHGFGAFAPGNKKFASIDSNKSHKGNKSLRLKRDKGTSTAATKAFHDVSSYGQVQIDFFYMSNKVPKSSGFVLEYRIQGESTWKVAQSFAFGTDWKQHKKWFNGSVMWSVVGVDSIQFRFRSKIANTKGIVNIDSVRFEGGGSIFSYRPGELAVHENGLLLSAGLTARIIATKDEFVQYDNGGQSIEVFHTDPDGAAVFEDNETGGWIYVSNSESYYNGGVGAITFDSEGNVAGYKQLLSGTIWNCGGGKTYWNTWLTCEENNYDTVKGQVWEVDPWGRWTQQTIMGKDGAAYESAAYDNRDPSNPVFFITTDEYDGPLVRFTPDKTAVQWAIDNDDYTKLLSTTGPTVVYEYFSVTTINDNGDGTYIGTFEWTTDIDEGRQSASDYHSFGEGIDVRDGRIYYTTKAYKYLFVIDLDNGTFTRSSTESGAFDAQPDQVARVLDFTTGETDGILYFCEEGGPSCGVHGRSADGRYFTILEAEDSSFGGETTGLAFSPDGMFMYVSFQSPGHIVEVKRTDGFPFHGSKLDIKYHANEQGINVRERLLFEDERVMCDRY